MGKIQVLPFEVANLIAAGEVVDRPASAIKEMMENSIDAGATHITVEVQHGGVTFMRVSDDGCGMVPEDLPVAVRRHATSKIREAEDLDGISTLGFRGEALAAIAAVSDLRLISRVKDAPYGAMLEVSRGQILGLTERGCSAGTTVIAENLFANVPARRKFLKRDVTETMAVSANVEKVALSHPEIAVRLITDGTVRLDTAGDGKLQSVIWAMYGKDFAGRLILLDSTYDGIRVHGAIGRSDNVRANRNAQNFFINHRYIKSKTATAALEQAYVSYMPQEKYPVCVLYLEMNPERVDVNVHPAKLEVKFSNEKPVFEAIYYAVRQALEENTTRPPLVPDRKAGAFLPSAKEAFVPVENGTAASSGRRQLSMEFGNEAPSGGTAQIRMSAAEYVSRYAGAPSPRETEPQATVQRSQEAAQMLRQAQPPQQAQPQQTQPVEPSPLWQQMPTGTGTGGQATGTMRAPMPFLREQPVAAAPDTDAENVPMPDGDASVPPQEAEGADTAVPETGTVTDYRYVGEVFNAYLLVEIGDRMLLIDKHAAHERIIFERLNRSRKRHDGTGQTLMIPLEVMMTAAEVQTLEDYRAEIEALGFAFGAARNTVSLCAIPVGLEPEEATDLLTVIAAQLADGTGNAALTQDTLFEKALYQASCKAAIKAGRVYPPEYGEQVVAQLMRLPDITFCPHGRPVALEMTKRELDRKFERT